MQRKTSSTKLASKNKLKPIGQMHRTIKNTSKCSEAYRKIPKVISDLEKNLHLLKKYYEEEENYQFNHHKEPHHQAKPKFTRPKSSINKRAKKIQEEETTIVPELEDVKKSFLTVNGYDSNNVVQLYNFYKKNMEKSTRIFGSVSGANSTHNFSDYRDNKRLISAMIVDNYQDEGLDRQSKTFSNQTKEQRKRKDELVINLSKGNSQLVNVANLLADRKKNYRQNICNNMNSENLYQQAKRKLVRPNTMENIERMLKNQENKRTENIRISPGRKLSKQKKSSQKQISLNQKSSPVRKSSQKQSAHKTPVENPVKQIQQVKLFSPLIKEWSGEKHSSKQKQLKQPPSGKSNKSGKSMRSPSLNKGLIFEVGQFSPLHMQKKPQFKKAKTSELTDSLLDCEISLKQHSRNLDLESIPFQF